MPRTPSVTKIAFLLRFVLVANILASAAGCVSIDERVSKLVQAQEFETALQELRAAKVAPIIDEGASPEAVKARSIFQIAVESDVSSSVENARINRSGRLAYSESERGVALCQWSASLDALRADCKVTVQQLDRFASEAATTSLAGTTMSERRVFLLEWKSSSNVGIRRLSGDSAELKSDLASTEQFFLDDIGTHLSSDQWRIFYADRNYLRIDLGLSGKEKREANSVVALFDCLCSPASELLARNQITSLASSGENLNLQNDFCQIRQSFDEHLLQHMESISADTPPLTNASLDSIAAAQSLASTSQVEQMRIRWFEIEGAMCAHRAITLSRDSVSAPLAWVLSKRASLVLDQTAKLHELSQKSQSAVLAAMAGISKESIEVSLAIAPQIDIQLQPLLEMQIKSALSASVSGRWSITWSTGHNSFPDVLINVTDARLEQPRFEGMATISSQYLSHLESVPNPQKATLKRRLDSQDMSVSFAESSLSSSISSHNIYPTQWSLMSVNAARSRYITSVNIYNSLVNQYNSTPATIQQRVHLPYSFQQGTLLFGLSVTGMVITPTSERGFTYESVDSDLVRRGTKPTDSTVAFRRDDPFEIDCSVAALCTKFDDMSHSVKKATALQLLDRPRDIRLKTDPAEVLALQWIDHPMKEFREDLESSDAPDWLRALGLEYHDADLSATPDPVMLLRPPSRSNFEGSYPERAVDLCCEVLCYSDQGKVLARSSGALISEDGKILTCSHGLIGSQITVKFLEGPLKGEYPARILRANARADVALLESDNLNAESWLEISPSLIPRGSAVFAVGSPSLDTSGSIAHLAITHGVIATPTGDESGMPRLVADVAIASGSSGGPLLESETGRVVGVVTAVSIQQFDPERASTKSLCLAAPTSELKTWLGVAYSMDPPVRLDLP